MPTITLPPDDVIKRMREISNESQTQSECIDRLMKEQTAFLEQLKREQERQLELQQLLAEKRYVEAHWRDGKFKSKIRRGNNKQNHKKKGRK